MKEKSISTNAFLNVFRTILSLIVPLITYPYVYRTLGAENLGKVNYVHSIIGYFILLSGLGISTYGIREGAKIRDNKEKVSSLISECFTIAFFMMVLSYFILFLLVSFSSSLYEYRFLFIIEGFLIFFDIIGIEWVNTVFEDYLYITIRTILVQILSVVLIFLFIHTNDDFYIYALITTVSTGLVSVLNWIHCKKKVQIKFAFNKKFKTHIKPILVFFANKLAVSLYVNSDITMIGYLIGDLRVGIYSAAVKIYTIVKTMIAAMYTVTLPRLSKKRGENDELGFRKLFSNLISFMTLAIFPSVLGLFILSPNVILLLFGEEYYEAGISLRILSIGIIFAIYGGIVSTVYNVTNNLEINSLKGTVLAAASNVLLNIVLIPSIFEIGAAITTVTAEFITFIYCFIKAKGIKDLIVWKDLLKNFFHAILGCIEIIFVVFFLNFVVHNNSIFVILCILFSVVLYGTTLFLLKNDIFISLIRKYMKVLKK